MNEIFKTSEKLSKKAIEDYGLKIYPKNTVLIAMYGQGKTRGQSSIIRIPAAITQNCAGITCNEEVVLPEYVWYYLMAIYEKIRGQDYSGGGVPHLNLKIAKNIKIPIPIMSRQKEIVSELSQKVKLLQDLRKMKTEAKRRINKILTDVWGVEYIETKTQEIEE
jgi:restriction endonuclease S subunit